MTTSTSRRCGYSRCKRLFIITTEEKSYCCPEHRQIVKEKSRKQYARDKESGKAAIKAARQRDLRMAKATPKAALPLVIEVIDQATGVTYSLNDAPAGEVLRCCCCPRLFIPTAGDVRFCCQQHRIKQAKWEARCRNTARANENRRRNRLRNKDERNRKSREYYEKHAEEIRLWRNKYTKKRRSVIEVGRRARRSKAKEVSLFFKLSEIFGKKEKV